MDTYEVKLGKREADLVRLAIAKYWLTAAYNAAWAKAPDQVHVPTAEVVCLLSSQKPL